MPTFVNDTFTDTNAVLLENHVGQAGATWTKHGSATGTIDVRANRVRCATITSIHYASGTAQNPDYDVEGVLFVHSLITSFSVAVCGRMDTSANTYYKLDFQYNPSGPVERWRLVKVVAGTITQVGSTFTQTLVAGNSYTVRLVMRGTSLKVLIDGVERIVATDSSITAAGRPGVVGATAIGTATGIHLDSLTAYDYVPLGASAATSGATLSFTAPTTVPLDPGAATANATLAVDAQRVHHMVATTSSVDGSTYASASFTPSVNDLLVVFVYASATNGPATATDSQGGTYTAVLQQSFGTTRLYVFIANQRISAATATTVTFDCTGDAASGTNIVVESVAGMTRLGVDASRQLGTGTTGAGNTPQVVLSVNAVTDNPVFAVVGNSTNPAALTPPSGWAEQADIGYSGPTTGLEVAYIVGGFAGTVVTWGSSSASTHIEAVLELDTSVLVPLGASGGSSSGTLAVSATTRIVLGTSAASSSATLGISASTRVVLNASAASSVATLTVGVPAGVPLNASAASSTASLSISAQTRIPLGTSAATASPTLVVKAQTTVALGTSAALTTVSLVLNAPALIALGSSAATTSATLTAKVPAGVPLATSAATATTSLAVSAQTTVALGTSAATTSPTLAVSAQTKVALNASAASTTTALTVTAVLTVPLGTSAASSTATATFTAITQVPLASSAGLASATLTFTAQTTITLGTSAGVSAATLAAAAPTLVSLGASAGQSATTAVLAAVSLVPLGTSAALSSATAAVKAQTTIALATSAAIASATLSLSGQTAVPLGTSAALSAATLNLAIVKQYGRPVADVATTGWTTTPLWSKLDEVTADDADLIEGVAA